VVTAVSDARSSANDQIAHAATVLKRSAKLRKLFEAICRGGKKPKSVGQLMKATKFGQVEVLQLGGKLADQQLVHKIKSNVGTTYEKDRFYAANRTKILRYATNPGKLAALPTKTSPRLSNGPIRIKVQGLKVRIAEVTCDDLDQFAAVNKFETAPQLSISERHFKNGIAKLIGEGGNFQDWGGEPNDLYTTKVRFKGKRRAVAFAFKGPGTKGALTPKKMGKNGDQIQRLFLSPADIFLVQYHDQVGQAIYEQMKVFATVCSIREGKQVWYGVIDGDDSNRIMAAYPKKFSRR
jgi:hypothetical protein